MSNFLINPFIFGSADATFTTIDLSDSPSQSDFDIDMSGHDELEVWFIDCNGAASVSPEIRVSNDGGSTFKTASGDYHDTTGSLGGSITRTYLAALQNNTSGVADLTAYMRMGGFNQTNNGVVTYGGGGRDAGGVDEVWNHSGHTTFNDCDYVRLGTTAQWGAVGTIVYRKTNWVSSNELTAADYSSDTSSTTFIDVQNYDEAFVRLRDITTGRMMSRVSTDGSSFLAGGLYEMTSADLNAASADTNAMSMSLDDGTTKYMSGSYQGFQDTEYMTARLAGHNCNSATHHMCFVETASTITDIGFSEFDDATNYTGGTVNGVAYEWNDSNVGTVSISSSDTEFVVPVGGAYTHGNVIFPRLNLCSADSRVNITVSTDNGSTYKSTGYAKGNDDDAWIQSTTNMSSGLHAGGAVNTGMFWLSGIDGGTYFTIFGAGDWIGDNSDQFGMYHGDTDAVTHIKFALDTGNWDTAWTARYRFWN